MFVAKIHFEINIYSKVFQKIKKETLIETNKIL